MAVLDNTVTSDDVTEALDIDLIERFTKEFSKLSEVLSIAPAQVVPAGQELARVTISGSLTDPSQTAGEGDEVALSKYGSERISLGALEVTPYRKETTAQAILQSGYENAILKTDRRMIADVRNAILTDFFEQLTTGAKTVTGSGLQACFANMGAQLAVTMEENGDTSENLVFFVNPLDLAEYLGNAQVTTQTVFGMTYIQNFLGVGNILQTAKVEQGKAYATPVENINVFAADFATLGTAGLDYTTQDGGLIGVKHEGDFARFSAVTNIAAGIKVIPEVVDYVVEATLGE